MKRTFKTLLIIVVIGALVYNFRAEIGSYLPELQTKIEDIASLVKSRISPEIPCKEPIPYALGSFDSRFNISKDYFLSALADAEAIWEKEQGDYAGADLFVYTPEDSEKNILKINLVYDDRQQATAKLKSLGIVVQDNRASYDALKVKFDALKAQYEKDKSAFNLRVQAFNNRQAEYDREVRYWNDRGGAPPEEYNKLQAQKSSLQAEEKQIKTLQNNLNAKAEEINALVVALNRLISSLNLSVEKYNSTNESRGESFEEGVYTEDGSSKEIDIYEFSNREKLVRVLAHELGHALGIQHVEDPKAIMYKLNQGDSTALAQADLDALKAACGQN